jgi:hypothetical protein
MPSNYRGYEECPNYFTTDMVKKEAEQSAVRMLDEIQPKAGDMQGHLEIYWDFKEIMELQVLSDKMPVRHDFEAPFEVEITWSEWEFMVPP